MASFARQTGETLSLRDAAAWIASATGSPEPHVSTVHRWAVRGVRGVRLGATRVGARFLTTANDLAEFLDRLNASPGASIGQQSYSPVPSYTEAVRQKQVEAACEELDRLCENARSGNAVMAEQKDLAAVRQKAATASRPRRLSGDWPTLFAAKEVTST